MFQPSEALLDPPAIPLRNLNLNVLNNNFARFEEKVALKGLVDDAQASDPFARAPARHVLAVHAHLLQRSLALRSFSALLGASPQRLRSV